MNRQTTAEIWSFALLVSLGVALRILCTGLPNIAPTAALAMFAGYYFRNWRVAVSVPLIVMLISDRFIGTYSWGQMLTVYSALTLPVFMRCFLKAKLNIIKPNFRQTAASVARVMGCSLCCSLMFFLVTNFSVWFGSTSYDQTFSGIVSCYVAAIPFLRYTLQGDFVFSLAVFGTYAIASNLILAYGTRFATNKQIETVC